MIRAVASALRAPRTQAQLVVLECEDGRLVLSAEDCSATDDTVLVHSGRILAGGGEWSVPGDVRLELTTRGVRLCGKLLAVSQATITCVTDKPYNTQCCMGESTHDATFEIKWPFAGSLIDKHMQTM
jgi:hypothetical protein